MSLGVAVLRFVVPQRPAPRMNCSSASNTQRCSRSYRHALAPVNAPGVQSHERMSLASQLCGQPRAANLPCA